MDGAAERMMNAVVVYETEPDLIWEELMADVTEPPVIKRTQVHILVAPFSYAVR